MTEIGRVIIHGTIVIACPLCEWSARNDVKDEPEAAARINYYLRRAFVEHVAREHGHEPPPPGIRHES